MAAASIIAGDDRRGGILATSPGALSAATAVAAEQGTGAPVAAFHTVRVALVLPTLPLLLRLSGG